MLRAFHFCWSEYVVTGMQYHVRGSSQKYSCTRAYNYLFTDLSLKDPMHMEPIKKTCPILVSIYDISLLTKKVKNDKITFIVMVTNTKHYVCTHQTFFVVVKVQIH